MAIVRSLAVGKAVNSAGNLTYQTVKGRTIAREKPVHVANPNTPAQQAQRSKMSNIVAAWREWFFQMAPYFTVIQGYGSAYNEFVKRNIHFAKLPWFENGVFEGTRARGAYLSTGKYSQNALAEQGTYGQRTVSINDAQLRNDLIVGDEIITVYHPDEGGNPVILKAVLDADDIQTLKNGDGIDFALPEERELAANIFWSPSRRISSTGILS